MRFILDFVKWLVWGPERNTLNSQPVLPPEKLPEIVIKDPAKKESPPFNFLKENDPREFLLDLHSIRPFTDQFNRAREELIKELQRLAPPKRYRGVRKDAA